MRTTIEKLAWQLSRASETATLSELAAEFGETPGRIIDALDVLKIRAGQPTQFPPVPWDEP